MGMGGTELSFALEESNGLGKMHSARKFMQKTPQPISVDTIKDGGCKLGGL